VIKVLIASGKNIGDPQKKRFEGDYTAIEIAAEEGHKEVALLLKRFAVDPA